MNDEQKYDACVAELRAFMEATGFTEMVMGLSGGLDSAVVCAMCVDAFGAENVHVCLMPGPYSTDHSLTDAQAEVDALGVDARVLSIKEPYEAFAAVLGPSCGGVLDGLASQNTQARCRAVCLMALSNKYGWAMVNTGNKSEAMMGYSTLYGDTCGVFAPIAGLYKTDVYAVARARNARAIAAGEKPPIPEHVLTKPPSAELAPDQKDEDALGIDYDALDDILIGHYEHGLSAEELAAGKLAGRRTVEQIADIIRRADAQAFKRRIEPPFPSTPFYA